jgi:two-component system copper resistance phosphate regulon response regulator CusR
MLQAVATAVEGLGAEVVRATTGGALIEHLAEDEPYQLMITDIAMPWMNGLQVAHAVRSSGLRLPIILISARATADIQRQIAALGGDAVLLRKPFALADLEAAVTSRLAAHAHQNPPAPGVPLTTP